MSQRSAKAIGRMIKRDNMLSRLLYRIERRRWKRYYGRHWKLWYVCDCGNRTSQRGNMMCEECIPF